MTGLTLATLFPLTTVAAGDEADAGALSRRATPRGIDVRTLTVGHLDADADADVYLLGGDGLAGVAELVEQLRAIDLPGRVRDGALVVAVDAGFAAVGRSWTDAQGREHAGLGIVGTTARATRAHPATRTSLPRPELGLPAMLGWSARAFAISRDPGVDFLVSLRGPAEGAPEHDGVLTERVVGTQLHGPVLALNPELADLVLARALGVRRLDPLPAPAAEEARRRRLAELSAAADPRSGTSWRRLRRRAR